MKKTVILTRPRRFTNGYLFIPVTKTDKELSNTFAEGAGDNYVKCVLSVRAAEKTYDQTRTLWGLVTALFELENGRPPATPREAAQEYMSLIMEYAPAITDVRHPDNPPLRLTLSQMDVAQASRFIQCVMGEVASKITSDVNGLLSCAVSDLFREFQTYVGKMKDDPRDFADDGSLLTIDEWKQRNAMSFCSGSTNGLQVCHILSRGAYPQFADKVWNLYVATADEHLNIQHAKGFDELIKIFPHIRGRIERAYRLAGEQYNGV